MKKHFSISITLVIVLSNILFSQNQNKIWYFGNQAGLDFNTSPPTVLVNGMLISNESFASIADAGGNLLFYTDGITIWDKTNSAMVNGTGLNGHQSTTQGALIIKQPGSLTRYFVFTLDAEGYNNGLQYSIVDMSLSSGNGAVIVKNVLIYSPSTEKLTATLHSNGVDMWIISHDYNSNKFMCFLLTSSGFSNSPVVSSIGPVHDGTTGSTHGYLKVSPDRKKIGLCITGLNKCELYDFDNLTGQISNLLTLSNAVVHPYGCEFSPDSRKFYLGGLSDTVLYQWDLCAGTNLNIVQSKVSIHFSPFYIAGMQLASNGKIYVARYLQQSLGVINFPNNKGVACNYSEFGQSISPGVCTFGLPNLYQISISPGPTISIGSTRGFSICSGESTTLSVSGLSSYTWSTGSNSSSLIISPPVSTSYSVLATSSLETCYVGQTTINVSNCLGITTGVEDYPELKAYPNPSQNQISLLLPSSDEFEYTIEGIDGKNYAGGEIRFLESIAIINTEKVPGGLFHLLLWQDGKLKYSKKIAVIRD